MVSFFAVAMVAGIALAQEPTAPAQPPEWRFDEMPDGRAFVQRYPTTAQELNLSGVAALCCTVRRNRRLSCNVVYEFPEDRGFGNASQSLAREFRVSQASYEALQARGELTSRRVISWRLPNIPADQQVQLAEASQRARTAECNAALAP
jgi:hypothetical protein